MASRVRVAASACCVASGLFISALGGALAFAEPGPGHSNDSVNERGRASQNDTPQQRAQDDSVKAPPSGTKPADTKPGETGATDTNPTDTKMSESPSQSPPPPTKTTSETTTKTTSETTTKTTSETTTKTSPTETTTKTSPTQTTSETTPPGQPGPTPPESGGDGAIVQLPRFKPPLVPDMQLPGELQPSQPGVPGGPAVLDAGAGSAAAAAPVGPAVPIALPVIVAPPIGLGVGGGGAGSGGASAGAPPAAPRAMPAEPPAGRITPPANVGSNAGVPNSSYRIGYTEYLRTAGLPQVAALAVPGLVGILVLTGAGGLLGYRQAKAGHAVHVSGSARFIR